MIWLRTFLFSLTTPGPDWVAKLGRFRNTEITLTLSEFILIIIEMEPHYMK